MIHKILPFSWSTGYYFRYPSRYFLLLLAYALQKILPFSWITGYYFRYPWRYFVTFVGLCITEDSSIQLKYGILFPISLKIFCYFCWLMHYRRFFHSTEVRDIISDILEDILLLLLVYALQKILPFNWSTGYYFRYPWRYFVTFVGLCITEDSSLQLKYGILFPITFKIFCYFCWLMHYRRFFHSTEVRDIISDILKDIFFTFVGLCITEDSSLQLKYGILFPISFKIFFYFCWFMHYRRFFHSTEVRDIISNIL